MKPLALITILSLMTISTTASAQWDAGSVGVRSTPIAQKPIAPIAVPVAK